MLLSGERHELRIERDEAWEERRFPRDCGSHTHARALPHLPRGARAARGLRVRDSRTSVGDTPRSGADPPTPVKGGAQSRLDGPERCEQAWASMAHMSLPKRERQSCTVLAQLRRGWSQPALEAPSCCRNPLCQFGRAERPFFNWQIKKNGALLPVHRATGRPRLTETELRLQNLN